MISKRGIDSSLFFMNKPDALIFDLSEVIIRGLVGIENEVAKKAEIPSDDILKKFGGQNLEKLCRGNISEKEYLRKIITEYHWNITLTLLQNIIRKNFHHIIENMDRLLYRLSEKNNLSLMSDHAREWIEYIFEQHEFLDCFTTKIFSYDTSFLKHEPESFTYIIQKYEINPEKCIFIDDNPANIRTAQKIGFRAIHFQSQAQLTKELTEQGIEL